MGMQMGAGKFELDANIYLKDEKKNSVHKIYPK